MMRNTPSRPWRVFAAVIAAAFVAAFQATAADGLDENTMATGFQTLESACFSCHSPDAAPADRIAPPMAAIRHRYLMGNGSFEAFRRDLVNFVNDPSATNARMRGALNRFGLMPKLSFDDATLNAVAYYLYHTPMDRPGWRHVPAVPR